MSQTTLTFETTPRNQGQIVEHSHARTASGAIIDRRHDRSDGVVTYYWRKSQRRLTAAELQRYGLDDAR